MRPVLTFRKYRHSDLEQLRAVFASNTPPFFDAAEWQPFEKFLATDLGTQWHYEVALIDQRIVGGGGFGVKSDNTVNLAWGMLDRQFHKKGLGKQLLERRLAQIEQRFPGEAIHVTTSQHTAGFFENHGFVATEVRADFWGEGLHLHRMIRYRLPEEALLFRPYTAQDLEVLQRVFLSNCPPYFEPGEWADFKAFLSNDLGEACFYEVAVVGGIVVGGGGIGQNADGTVSLCWGLLDALLHKKGFGKVLLERRLQLAEQLFAGAPLVLSTTQHTYKFFEKYGFVITAYETDHWAKGLHLYKMIKQHPWKK